MLDFVLTYYIFIKCSYYPLEACFQMRDRKGVDLYGREGREELGGVEVGETIIRIY